jgi:hypothetical protein
MNKQLYGKKFTGQLKLAFYSAAFAVFFGGAAIYAFFRNINNMALFHFFPKPSFLNSLYSPIQSETIWSNMFIYNLPYGLWCLSGLLLVRAIWLHNAKWRAIYSGVFITIVMSYVFLKLPGITPGTFDVLDLIFMGFFAFVESLIFNLFIRRRIV